ncbi:MAG: aminopeptidase P N-terminal domain-containing protein [Lentimicrobium sp.]|mgnify:FL=1|jgi:Xaa-Pro aminopeptidase|uniref:aminopeptidase P N-terminal domain-containing protein n=2 Tax=Lentimicrobium sp. TaxID=2034841 RepID=UPI0025F44E4E|nr:aminopeptidase P N-terminal domain-containing protein [Lentimicrobium sp.]MCO5257895.1 aminopeptidase P N-terminal domain-containing protein [Lentimicrobium sp.]MCO5262167.1 aminopeptidase P N-terminal domain-containing protein [Lentimicrobium sp.]HPF63361.1 aminopeptidase P N-terminal domain-containing protein [Lentimicrobium sp.]HRW69661.1 aminopeptidase P N-terminal domain-containing protein [Lentimicrobium sp.]
MRYKSIDPDLFRKNREKLEKKLKPNALAVIHANDEMPRNGDQCFVYRQNSDLFYLTGLDQEKCILTLFPNHPVEAMREIVFTVRTNDRMVTWYGHKYTLEQVTEISGVKNVRWLDDFDGTFRDLMARAEFVYLNQNENPRFTTEVPSRDLRFMQQLRNDYPLHAFERLAPLLTDLRMVKESEEIEMINRACEITGDAFGRVLNFVKPGVLEYEVEAEITHEFLRNGASGHAYPPIIASGVNNCILHYNQNDQVCKDGDLLLLDFGAEYGNYAGDCSRTIPVNGKFSPRQRQVYEAVLRVLRKASRMLVPGTTIDKYHAEICKIVENELIGLGLFSREDVERQDPENPLFFKYYMHGTSHFMGLDVHDVGSKQHPLRKGMVLSCEPAIYIPEEGFGIRLENDILVDEEPVDLMAHIPIEPDDIEALMAR